MELINKGKQQTVVQFGGDKVPSIKDQNVSDKN